MSIFEGKVIVITGAASGMGLATAQVLAERGAQISLANLNERGLNAALETLDHETRHMCSVVNVSKAKSVDAWITSAVERYGKIDGAVKMAGIITNAVPITEVSDKDWDFTFDVNVKGVFNCLRAELKAMASEGSIVSAASVFGQFGAPGNSAYCASKAAVIGMSRTAAKENRYIRVNCLTRLCQHCDVPE